MPSRNRLSLLLSLAAVTSTLSLTLGASGALSTFKATLLTLDDMSLSLGGCDFELCQMEYCNTSGCPTAEECEVTESQGVKYCHGVDTDAGEQCLNAGESAYDCTQSTDDDCAEKKQGAAIIEEDEEGEIIEVHCVGSTGPTCSLNGQDCGSIRHTCSDSFCGL